MKKQTEEQSVHWFEKIVPGMTGKTKEKKVTGPDAAPADSLSLEKHLAEVHLWVNEITEEVPGGTSRHQAFDLLRGVLRTMRDRMPVEEVFQFSAQLPVLVRGFFFEGYDITGKPLKMSRAQFLERLEQEIGRGEKVMPSAAFEGVLNTLYRHVSRGELEDIYATMPADIRELWDSCLHPSHRLKN